MLHRLRSVLVRPGRECLHGTVEVDETYLGGRGHVCYRLLELAISHGPIRYRDVAVGGRQRKVMPAVPLGRGHPPGIERLPADRPWRHAISQLHTAHLRHSPGSTENPAELN